MGKIRQSSPDYKGPLLFSALLAVVAAVCVFIVATGGWVHKPRFDLAFIAFGVVFIISLMISAILTMTAKSNVDPDGIAAHKEKKDLGE
ncbi:MAG: hypothetical protein QM632_06815 [Micrococcaceae bacterium]